MPPRLVARPPADPAEERRLRRLAGARHAPASWIQRARIVVGSWDGATVNELAKRLGCRTKTVYKWLHRFNAAGMDGLGDLPRPGKPRRITDGERARIVQLARSAAPPARAGDGREPTETIQHGAHATWTLDTLTAAARAAGIQVGRSQLRSILLAEGIRWQRSRSWTTRATPPPAPEGPAPSPPATPVRRPKRP